MNWAKGYSAAYYMTRVDPSTWRDMERFEITGGSVKRTETGLRESAAVDCGAYPTGIENWIRVYMDTNQDGAEGHTAVFTGLATSPGDDINGRIRKSSLDCYSVLKPAEDVKLLRGWYAPAGMSGGAVIRELLKATPAPVTVADNAPTLTDHVIAENGENNLTMVEKILTAINWRIRISGDGTISVEPKSDDPVQTFDPLENDAIEMTVKVKTDWFSLPNVYMAVQDDLTAIARDDDPESPLSTVSRGREVWAQESSCQLAENETIASYAYRRLKEAQQTSTQASYDRRFYPDVVPGDKIRLHYPEQGLDGIYTVESQSITLSHAGKTSEDVKR